MNENNVQLIKESVNDIFKNVDIIKDQIKMLSGIKSMTDIITNINIFGSFTMNIVYTIERVSKLVSDTVTSDDKLNAAISIIDDKINFPWYLEVVDEYIFKIIIKLSVLIINNSVGHVWDVDKIINAN